VARSPPGAARPAKASPPHIRQRVTESEVTAPPCELVERGQRGRVELPQRGAQRVGLALPRPDQVLVGAGPHLDRLGWPPRGPRSPARSRPPRWPPRQLRPTRRRPTGRRRTAPTSRSGRPARPASPTPRRRSPGFAAGTRTCPPPRSPSGSTCPTAPCAGTSPPPRPGPYRPARRRRAAGRLMGTDHVHPPTQSRNRRRRSAAIPTPNCVTGPPAAHISSRARGVVTSAGLTGTTSSARA
jgi:hypothetical protein